MKSAEIYSVVEGVLKHYDMPDAKAELEKLAEKLAESVRLEAAASHGCLDATKAAAKLLKGVDDKHPRLRYAWTNDKGLQCFCDGFHGFRLREALPLAPRPDDAEKPINLDGVIAGYGRAMELPMPSVADLKAAIGLQKAQYIGEHGNAKGWEGAIWDFGDALPTANAAYLLDAIAILGEDVKAFAASSNGSGASVVSPVMLESERGDGIVLPILTDKKRAVYNAQKAEAARVKTDEELRAADHLERAEKRIAHLEKLLDDMLNQYRRDNAVPDAPGMVCMEPGEFAELAKLQQLLVEERERAEKARCELDEARKAAKAKAA